MFFIFEGDEGLSPVVKTKQNKNKTKTKQTNTQDKKNFLSDNKIKVHVTVTIAAAVGLNKIYFICHNTLTVVEQLGRGASNITYNL